MQALKTQIDQQSEFRANADTVRALVEDLRTKVTDVAAHGGAEAVRACATSTLRPSFRRYVPRVAETRSRFI
jgi:hypothetical protein